MEHRQKCQGYNKETLNVEHTFFFPEKKQKKIKQQKLKQNRETNFCI